MWDLVLINYWGVLAGAVAMMLVGWIWYAKPVFGVMWMDAIGKKESDLKGGGAAMGWMFVGALVTSYVLAHFVSVLTDGSISSVLTLVGWIWLGFVATAFFSTFLFEGRAAKLFFINAGYQLVALSAAAIAIGMI